MRRQQAEVGGRTEVAPEGHMAAGRGVDDAPGAAVAGDPAGQSAAGRGARFYGICPVPSHTFL